MDITKLVNLHRNLQLLLDEHADRRNNPDTWPGLKDEIDLLFEKCLAGRPLSPEIKNVTILLADIRGFTAISEKYPPIQVIDLLNNYFELMVPIIARHGGEIDKYMGDSIMALFYTEDDPENAPLNALSCAVEMQQAMEKVNTVLQGKGMEKLYMGIGINTGDVVCSAMGTDIHREYTVIGDQVNLTARVEAFTLRGQILISDNTRRLVSDWIETGDTNEVSAKGKNRAIVIHELLAVTRTERLEVPERDGRRSPRVTVDLPSSFQIVEGKKISPDVLPARVLDISYGGVSMMTGVPISKMSDIRLHLNFDHTGKPANQVYAKVLRVTESDTGFNYGVEFTALADETKKSIKQLVDTTI